jgi:hypothetical protein
VRLEERPSRARVRGPRGEPFQLGDSWPPVNLVGPPVPAVRFVHVASARSCAVVGLAHGTVVRCRGDGVPFYNSSELDLGMDETALALGGRHACAVGTDRVTVKCWGRNTNRQFSSPSETLISPAAGLHSVLANETDKSAVLAPRSTRDWPTALDGVQGWSLG